MPSNDDIKLTEYSRGGGCGCKIAPGYLVDLLAGIRNTERLAGLIVGNETLDDAAIWDLGNGIGLISSVDFFTPIVNNPYTFGRIAASNAISDIYAMGGTPLIAQAIFGWPAGKLPLDAARSVIEGGRAACTEAGVPLTGGHSINNLEPIFGLAVNGLVSLNDIKRNGTAQPGDVLLLTKPLGIGILSTAEKFGLLTGDSYDYATRCMLELNKVGTTLGSESAIHAMTDVTGYGLLGHLHEMCIASSVNAHLYWSAIPILEGLSRYIVQGAVPSGTARNWHTYRAQVYLHEEEWSTILCDPQTNGGLLVAVAEPHLHKIQAILERNGLANHTQPIGRLLEARDNTPVVTVIPFPNKEWLGATRA